MSTVGPSIRLAAPVRATESAKEDLEVKSERTQQQLDAFLEEVRHLQSSCIRFSTCDGNPVAELSISSHGQPDTLMA
jgi:hypothetical protein